MYESGHGLFALNAHTETVFPGKTAGCEMDDGPLLTFTRCSVSPNSFSLALKQSQFKSSPSALCEHFHAIQIRSRVYVFLIRVLTYSQLHYFFVVSLKKK